MTQPTLPLSLPSIYTYTYTLGLGSIAILVLVYHVENTSIYCSIL